LSRRRNNNKENNTTTKNKFVGILEVSTRGAAVVICENIEEKIHIENIGQYLHSDVVEVYVFTRKKNGKYLGDITNLIK